MRFVAIEARRTISAVSHPERAVGTKEHQARNERLRQSGASNAAGRAGGNAITAGDRGIESDHPRVRTETTLR
jgi:hypothetical protein